KKLCGETSRLCPPDVSYTNWRSSTQILRLQRDIRIVVETNRANSKWLQRGPNLLLTRASCERRANSSKKQRAWPKSATSLMLDQIIWLGWRGARWPSAIRRKPWRKRVGFLNAARVTIRNFAPHSS